MSEKAWKRLKILLIILGILLFTGYFALRTFVFDPFEGDFGPISSIIPRTVDFYLRKKNITEDFRRFPEPLFYEELSKSLGWERFLRSSHYRDLNEKHQIEKNLADLQQNLAILPVDILGDLIGRELVIAGRKPSGSKEITDFALFTRVSWKVKLGLGLMRYESLRSRFAPQLQVEEGAEGIMKIKGAAPREIYLWRDRDLVVVGTDPWFLSQAQHLLDTRGEDSLGLSAKYYDEVQRFAEQGNELEFLVDVEDLVSRHLGKDNWPLPSWDLEGRILAEFLRPEAFQEGLGLARVEQGLNLRCHWALNGDQLSDFQRRLYEQHALLLVQDVGEKSKAATRRSFLFGTLACEVGECLKALERALDDNQRRLVNDQLRSAGSFRDLKQFIEEFAPAFKRNISFSMQKNDYPKLQGDPPSDGSPDPLWAIGLSIKNQDKVNELVSYFVRNKVPFGIEGIYQYQVGGGYQATEFWSQLIPATGEFAVLVAGDTFFISNSVNYLKEILRCKFSPAEGGRLADEPNFSETLNALEPSSNFFLYFDSRRFQEVFKQQIPFLANKMFQIDYATERLKAREKILREKYPQHQGKPLPPDVAKEVEKLIQQEIDNLEVTMRGPGIQKLRQEMEDYGLWLSSFPQLFLSIKTGRNSFDMSSKVFIDWK